MLGLEHSSPESNTSDYLWPLACAKFSYAVPAVRSLARTGSRLSASHPRRPHLTSHTLHRPILSQQATPDNEPDSALHLRFFLLSSPTHPPRARRTWPSSSARLGLPLPRCSASAPGDPDPRAPALRIMKQPACVLSAQKS
eukprot:2718714-Rhodomonas_salina.2